MSVFRFKHFSINQSRSAMKVGTDAMILGALCEFPISSNLLDIGTGTGVLSLILAQRFSPLSVTAVDIEVGALEDARANFAASTFETEFHTHLGSISDFNSPIKYEGIISNPPFFDNSSKSSTDNRNLARHTDSLSDKDLLSAVARLLAPNGQFWVIIPGDKAESFIQTAKSEDLHLAKNIAVYGKPQNLVRSVLCFSFTEQDTGKSRLTIRDSNGNYTPDYILLTKELHDRDLSL